jgi:hypothetical protein
MSAAIDAPVRPAPARAARSAPLSFLRLLRIELRRSPLVLILPLIAALFWFDSYRPSTAQQPLWILRTFWNLGQGGTIVDFGPFVAGMAAWIGSRNGRRRTADLVTTMVRPQWTTQLATWAATVIWAVVAYLVFVGVLFGVYAHQGVQGRPPWWWVAVGATAVAAFSAAGFAVGTLFPSRYAAPLAAFGGFLAMVMSSQTGFSHHTGWALILPTNSHGNYDQQDSGIFYPHLPDLPIARIMFLAGILAVFLGLLGLPARAGGRWLRRTAAVVTVAGLAATGTAVGLAATARLGPYGMVIPALHDAASDRPIAYTPVCGLAAQTPVCLNPAYRRYLPDVTAALAPALAEVAGVPGAPQRATQVAVAYDGGAPPWMTISGSPPVLTLPLGAEASLPGSNGFQDTATTTTQFVDIVRAQFAQAFVGAAGTTDSNDAQQAVGAALLQRTGIPPADLPKLQDMAQVGQGPKPGPATGPAYAAAQRLAALPDTAWHDWLAAHLAALRSGDLTLEQLP